MLTAKDIRFLRCLKCKNKLSYYGTQRSSYIDKGQIRCKKCEQSWSVKDGLVFCYDEQKILGTDRLLRVLYNSFARLHDPAVRYLLPLMHYKTEDSLRKAFVKELGLNCLFKRKTKNIKILEVGIGAGANLGYILKHVPNNKNIEYWGIDLSLGMLASCQKRVKKQGYQNVKYLLADAHYLPFADKSFDCVFHIGAFGNFHNPQKAITEMVRVSKRGTRVVISDEELYKPECRNLYEKAMFKLITFYDKNPHAPVELVPQNCTNIKKKPISHFYYCLSFQKG